MALSLADRVRETTTTTGTGTVTLAGAVTGYQSFAVVGNGNATYYCIAGQDVSEWEVGIGTYTSSGTTLARTTVLSSSNSGSLVNFSAGIKDVFVTYPGERAVVTSVTSITSASTITPDSTYAQYEVTALAVPATIAAPSGTPIDGQKLVLRIVDNGTARSLTWTTSAGAYRPRNVSLPAATVASNQMYVSCIYNAADNYWDVLLVSTGAGYTANGVVYANSTTSLTTGTALTFDGTVLTLTNGLIDLSSGYSIRWGGSASGIYAGSGTSDMVFTVGSSERLRINGTNGNVGIGTSSPSGKLDVQGAGGGVALQIKRDSSSVLQFYQGGGVNYIDAAAASSQFAFLINSSEKMRLDASGNLGIGTSSPAYKLHVVAASGIAAGFDRGDGSPAIIDLRTSGTTRGYLGATTSVPFIVYNSAPTELMRLDASGNLGLGVTPSAWVASWKAIQGNSGGSFGVASGGNGMYVLSNAYYNTSGSPVYTSSSYASMYQQINGSHLFQIAASGTAGNAITFTQAMTLDASGNLGVGTEGNSLTNRLTLYATGSTAQYLAAGNSNTGLNGTLFGVDGTGNAVINNTQNFSMLFSTSSTERARITSGGNFCVGTTGINDAKINLVAATGQWGIKCFNAGSGSQDLIAFNISGGGTSVGAITTNGTNTTYGTSSDQRLKENIVDAPSASDDIDAIQVRSFNWKVNKSHQKYGMIAQELMTVAPDAVLAGDDGEEVERTWGVDYSKLVPMLVKEIQSLRARVAQLESK